MAELPATLDPSKMLWGGQPLTEMSREELILAFCELYSTTAKQFDQMQDNFLSMCGLVQRYSALVDKQNARALANT